MCLVALGAALVISAHAGAATSRLAVNDGREYTRSVRVTVGDQGYSPFFGPGVVVWDGGSIMAGYGAGKGTPFPAQTLAVVPRACLSYFSITSSARIADMLAQAPYEVDAHYDPAADLNVCVVQAGGGDMRAGVTAASVYDALRSYCLQRRSAGFKVVVLSILPSGRPEAFEAARLAFNAMLRDTWSSFADGLADVAADSRIGDAGDQYDSLFYLTDELHLTAAGQAVMASVTAPVLTGLSWLSARCELRARDAAGEWSEWRHYAPVTNLWLDEYQGEHAVEAEYRLDGGDPVPVSDTIFLDSVRPAPKALRAVRVETGHRAVLWYRVDDALPCGPTCTVRISVQSESGALVKRFVRELVPVNRRQAVTFACVLPKGRYRYVVTARDTAGNPELQPSRATLIVR